MVNETGFSWLLNGLSLIFASVITYLDLPLEPVKALFFLVMLDFVTGIMKAVATDVPISSARMKKGALTKIAVLLVPIIIAVTARGVGENFNNVIEVSLWMLVIAEGYSNISNVHAIKTKKELPEWDVIAILGKKFREYLDKFGG
jgi:toxin secretion/phage lysis holin